MIIPRKKGDCYDNVAMESWNYSLKVEAIHGEKFLTRTEAKQQVFEYFEVYSHKASLKIRLSESEAFEAKMVSWKSVREIRERSIAAYCLLKNLQRN